MEQHYSHLFVVMMGMGVTFIGLTAIIFLTMLMGKIISRIDERKPDHVANAPKEPTQPLAKIPDVHGDGISDCIKIAIIAALAQEPGFRLDHVTRIDIKRAI